MSRTSMRQRIARYYAVVLVAVLLAFAATVWGIIEIEEAAEPPEVAAIEPPEHTDRNLLIALAIALTVVVPLAVAGAARIARRGLGALEDVASLAEAVDTERLDQRVALHDDAPVEVARLVVSMNSMLERLEHSVSGMRRFTADASHELRTPLSALMTELEVTLRKPRDADALRETVGAALESLQDMSRLVESLLVQAQADARALPIVLRSLELGPLVRRLAQPYEAVLAANGVTLRLELDEATASGDPLWIGRVVTNLLDNTTRHTRSGDQVIVRVALTDGFPVVEVEDSGAGVAEADVERIFERFYRGETARASGRGFGLGLSLSREIARALGGELSLGRSGPKPRFVLRLTNASFF